MSTFVASIDVAATYTSALAKIDEAIASNDHAAILRVYNQKEILAIAARGVGLSVDRYVAIALAELRLSPALRAELAQLICLPAIQNEPSAASDRL